MKKISLKNFLDKAKKVLLASGHTRTGARIETSFTLTESKEVKFRIVYGTERFSNGDLFAFGNTPDECLNDFRRQLAMQLSHKERVEKGLAVNPTTVTV